MRKVLIIYYQQESITSTIRLGGLIKYLPNYGWEPIILTNKNSQELSKKYKVITVPFDDNDYEKDLPKIAANIDESSSIVNKVIRYLWEAFLLFPDQQKDWCDPSIQAVEKLLKNEHIDALISSFPIVTSHLIAKSFKDNHGIPWIADMRDLWTQYNYYKYNDFFPRKFREKRLELSTLSHADYLTIVSKPMAKKLKKLHKNNIDIIPNGFDPDKISFNPHLSKKFTITYAGGLWTGKRDPTLLFEAIRQLKSENKIIIEDFQINFYGPIDVLLKHTVNKFSLEEIVKIHGLIDREDVLKREWESQILLLLRWDNPDEWGVVPGKIFEYLAAKRPILSIGSVGGTVEEILKETNAGVNLVNLDEIKEEIENFYYEFKKFGAVSYNGIPEEIEKYSHRRMACKFANILNKIIKN
ncbi:MAG: glycosyltransferase [Methanobacterium sp.]|jgi:hypothetical protein